MTTTEGPVNRVLALPGVAQATQGEATKCDRCNGSGHEPDMWVAEPCVYCRGKGLVNVSPARDT